MMLADALRAKEDADKDENGNPIIDNKPNVYRELSSKEDIKKYINGLL